MGPQLQFSSVQLCDAFSKLAFIRKTRDVDWSECFQDRLMTFSSRHVMVGKSSLVSTMENSIGYVET